MRVETIGATTDYSLFGGKAQRALVGFETQTPGLQVMHANYVAKGLFPWPSDMVNCSIVVGLATV